MASNAVQYGEFLMNRKPTRQSPGTPVGAKKLMAWIKDRQICAACAADGPVINHHCYGSTYKVRVGFERVQIGEWAVIGLCGECDSVVTHGSRKTFTERFGPQSELWLLQVEDYPGEIPLPVFQGIARCKK